jgi:hypothetical protein
MTPEDIAISVPATWRQRSDPQRGIVVNARATALPASGVAPELTVRCTVVDTDLAAWRTAVLEDLARRLVDFELEDDDEFDLLGDRVAYHRFAHRLGAADVLSDQWAWLSDGLGVTLTCSAARPDYPDYCDVFEAIAETMSIGPRAA